MEEPLSPASLFADLRAVVARIREQLPYLLLTGSSENYLRDTLAFQLSTKHRLVARDYPLQCNGRARKADIAFLGTSGPRAIVEMKQLYLKDFRREGHAYVRNIVDDVADRQSVCPEVYGIALARRVPSEWPLPWADEFAYTYVAADQPFSADGVARLHRVLRGLPGFRAVYPVNWQEARVLPVEEARSGVELHAWVMQAAELGATPDPAGM